MLPPAGCVCITELEPGASRMCANTRTHTHTASSRLACQARRAPTCFCLSSSSSRELGQQKSIGASYIRRVFTRASGCVEFTQTLCCHQIAASPASPPPLDDLQPKATGQMSSLLARSFACPSVRRLNESRQCWLDPRPDWCLVTESGDSLSTRSRCLRCQS